MQQLKLRAGSNALVVVAHPDDETIWLGGTLHKFSKLNWTILALCRASDSDRAPKFKKVCAHYGAEAIIGDLEDEDKLTIKQTIPLIKKFLLKQLKGQSFDYFFTHGANGEYGHPRHIGAHLAVKELLKSKKIKTEQIFYFNYKKQSEYILVPKADSTIILKLSPQELARKKQVMSQIYGFDPKGIDTNYCTKTEAFKILYKN